MSLLNNALREAEERQRRPQVTGAYTGAVEQGRSGPRWPVVVIVLLALGLLAAGIYWVLVISPEPSAATDTLALTSDNGQVERPQPDLAREPAIVPQPAPELAAKPEPAPRPELEAPKPPAPEPRVREVQVASNPAAEPSTPAEKSESSAPSKPSSPSEKSARLEPGPTAAVKTTPQSPGAIDRQAAKELETLIARGRMVEAEARLTNLVQVQAAPRSRFTMARALLVEGDIRRALDWLPATAAAEDARLRMLRARAQHAGGQLDAAVATLEANIPPVSELQEYRVTLATLLQQQGQGQDAAAQWAELIAWDDSRAPWWVGLAIALEDQGELRGATRAYEQAATLPGLSPSLADYVQRRLQSLRAG